MGDGIESGGCPRQRDGFSRHSMKSVKGHRSLPSIDWDVYSKSGNKATSVWLIALFFVLGLSVQQASLSTIVAERATIRSNRDYGSFASPDLATSGSPSIERNVVELPEGNEENLQPSSESGDEIIEEESSESLRLKVVAP